MKLQDIVFIVVFVLVALKRSSTLSAAVGLICLLASIPLFAMWVFFTAEHLVWYEAAFFTLSVILLFNRK